jgi:NAD(P)-dependent dehydrogenase (short-subunit alcohol dehydrogenase family)
MELNVTPSARRLEGKVAIVTGAGSSAPGLGNGKAIATLFARHGAKVVLVDLNSEAVKETELMVAQEGAEMDTCIADVARSEDVQKLVQQTMTRFGRIDVLVNNVGIVEIGSVVDTTEESWDRVMSVNLRAMFLTMKYAIPSMIQGGGGRIVNVSSVAAIRIGVPYCSYYASKAAVNQLTKSVAVDFARQGIRANTIMPGLIDTPLPRSRVVSGYSGKNSLDEMLRIRAELSPTGAQGVAWDIAEAALFLASDGSNYVNGTDLVVDGGYSALSPLVPRQ